MATTGGICVATGGETLQQHLELMERTPEVYRPARCPQCDWAGMRVHGRYYRKGGHKRAYFGTDHKLALAVTSRRTRVSSSATPSSSMASGWPSATLRILTASLWSVPNDTRVVLASTYNKGVTGLLKINAANEVRFRDVTDANACFVAGTLVHTSNGLVPIEKIRVGDLVLSQPEGKGLLTYKPVVNTFVHEDQEVCLVEYYVADETTPRHLVVTANHPFWVKDVGWTSAANLDAYHTFELFDGTDTCVASVLRILNTETPDVGWTCDDGSDMGPVIDLRDDKVEVSKTYEEYTSNDYALGGNGYLKRRVYNIEVEGFHTYYVGEAGIWVHNANCGGAVGTVLHSAHLSPHFA